MDSPNDKSTYEAIIKIEGNIISKTTGNDIDVLKVHLSDLCDLEHSGAEGEIIEIATGSVIYRCHKQTIIDK